MWRLSIMLVNNQWVTEGIKEEILKKIMEKKMETNENGNTMTPNP